MMSHLMLGGLVIRISYDLLFMLSSSSSVTRNSYCCSVASYQSYEHRRTNLCVIITIRASCIDIRIPYDNLLVPSSSSRALCPLPDCYGLRRRCSRMWCLDGIGRESWEWAMSRIVLEAGPLLLEGMKHVSVVRHLAGRPRP